MKYKYLIFNNILFQSQLKKNKSTKDFTPHKLLQDKTTFEIQEEWKNFTGFLVALCGVTLNKEIIIKGRKIYRISIIILKFFKIQRVNLKPMKKLLK